MTEVKPSADGTPKKVEYVELDEFYVKYKNFSYLHCEWRTEDELQRGDRRISSKIKRYQQKKQQSQNVLDFVSTWWASVEMGVSAGWRDLVVRVASYQ